MLPNINLKTSPELKCACRQAGSSVQNEIYRVMIAEAGYNPDKGKVRTTAEVGGPPVSATEIARSLHT